MDEVPITYVTNGVHVPTWIAPELRTLYNKYLGKDWLEKQDDIEMWQHIDDIPDEELWARPPGAKGEAVPHHPGKGADSAGPREKPRRSRYWRWAPCWTTAP